MNIDLPALDAPVEPPESLTPPRPTRAERGGALLEVVLCSDYPTQLLLGLAFAAFGVAGQTANGELRTGVVTALLLLDTALLVGLMWLFLVLRGDRPRDIFLGSRPATREALAGVPMIFAAFLLAATVLLSIRLVAPWLHNVDSNPLQQLLRTPADTAMFAVVAVVAGGIREELQRAFLLNRFERWLGGGTVGVIVASTGFGLGHVIQGFDAALATGVLGAFWALVYLRRRSIIAPVVSHAGFNLLQLVQLLALRRYLGS